MSRLEWLAVGERYYEGGVDRGVLFVDDNPGVPWNGLTNVTERYTGGGVRSFYIDGVKYVQTTPLEDFEATITAFYSPKEFDECDGTTPIAVGLYATQQSRKPFGFSYRTMIGNDTDGNDHGYKIHVVYNALATPSERSYETLSDNPEAQTLSWDLTTMPVDILNAQPSAHMIINSLEIDANLLADIEAVLYGSDTTFSSLPSPEELLAIISPLTAVDNGDGTVTISGGPVVDNGDGTFTISHLDVEVAEDGYTFTVPTTP